MAEPAQEQTRKLTIAEFAAKIKQRDPALAQVPDDVLVRKVLERRPDMLNFLQTSEQRKPAGKASETGYVEDFQHWAERVAQQRMKEDLAAGTSPLMTGVRQFAPDVLASAARVYRGLATPTNVGLAAGTAAFPLLGAVAGPYFAGQGLSELTHPSTPAEPLGSPESIERRLLGGAGVAGGIAGGRAAIDPITTGVRIGAQELAGAGKEPVLQARIKYQQALDEFNRAAVDKKLEYAGKLAEARRNWVDKAMEARRAQATAARTQGQREAMQKGQEAYADRLHDNLQRTFQTVKGRLDSRWNQLRSTPIRRGGSLTILKDEPLNSRAIADTIDVAEKKFLQGSPESIKQFRDLMNWMRVDAAGNPAVDVPGGPQPLLRPITWDEARTHYSALGDRMFSGDLPGNVQNAIRFVRDQGLGKELRAGAQTAGALPAYESLLYDWSRYENDWKNTGSVTLGGGSPLARALKAPSGKTLAPQVLGKTGDLLLERLGKYTDAGASPATGAALRKMNADMQALPKPKAPEMPGPFEPPAEPKIGEPPAPPDPAAVRHAKLLERASGRPGWYDFLFPPAGFEHLLLKNPKFREWVATQPRSETAIPELLRRPPAPPAAPAGPESEMEFVTRRGPGEQPTSAGASLDQQRALVDTLRARFEHQKAAKDPAMWATAAKLRDVESLLRAAELAQWGEKYRKPAATPGGGANYTAEDLQNLLGKYPGWLEKGQK